MARMSKTAAYFHCLGHTDELNAQLGVVYSWCFRSEKQNARIDGRVSEMRDLLVNSHKSIDILDGFLLFVLGKGNTKPSFHLWTPFFHMNFSPLFSVFLSCPSQFFFFFSFSLCSYESKDFSPCHFRRGCRPKWTKLSDWDAGETPTGGRRNENYLLFFILMLVLLSLLDLFHVIDVSKLKSILRFLCLLSSAVRKRWAFFLVSRRSNRDFSTWAHTWPPLYNRQPRNNWVSQSLNLLFFFLQAK